jgi:DNA-binding XRE family transcriptional regulator
MRSLQGVAIRTARIAAKLTQDQLGHRIGVKGRAIYRWERGATVPTQRNRAALIAAISILDQGAAHSKDGMMLMQPRWAMSLMRGPMTRNEIRQAVRGHGLCARDAFTPAAASTTSIMQTQDG